MSWALLFRAREYLRGSLWFYPLAGAILGALLALLTQQADASVTVPQGWRYAPSTASTVLSTIVGATVGLTGFVVTFSLLRQVGTNQAPNIGVSVAGFLLVVSLVLFLLFFDRFIHRLRPVAVAALAGQVAMRTIVTVTRAAQVGTASATIATGEPVLMVPTRRDGSIQAVDVAGL